jgi:hypothetical protein
MQLLEDDLFIILVRLEPCKPPFEKLEAFQYVNLFMKDGYSKLLKSLHQGALKKTGRV